MTCSELANFPGRATAALPVSGCRRATGARGPALDWLGDVARFNPVEWAIVAGRDALHASPAWADIGSHLALLAALTVVMTALATAALRAYQRPA